VQNSAIQAIEHSVFVNNWPLILGIDKSNVTITHSQFIKMFKAIVVTENSNLTIGNTLFQEMTQHQQSGIVYVDRLNSDGSALGMGGLIYIV
jgi:hypothetical protein